MGCSRLDYSGHVIMPGPAVIISLRSLFAIVPVSSPASQLSDDCFSLRTRDRQKDFRGVLRVALSLSCQMFWFSKQPRINSRRTTFMSTDNSWISLKPPCSRAVTLASPMSKSLTLSRPSRVVERKPSIFLLSAWTLFRICSDPHHSNISKFQPDSLAQ